MTPETVFNLSTTLAGAAWLFLVGPARWMPRSFEAMRTAVPLVLACVYVAALATAAPTLEGGFGSLAGVGLLFSNPWALLAGWVHYLAFDFLVGTWMLARAKLENLSHWLLVPALVLTFLLGPAGLLCFHLMRCFVLRRRPQSL